MNKTVKLLVFISILTGFTCCSRDMIDDPDSVVPEGYIRAALDLQVEEPDSIQTRATSAEENAYDESNVWVLLFNATSTSDGTPTTLVQAPVKAIKSGSQLYVLLRATTQPVTTYVVAGLSSTLNTYMGTASNFTEGTTTFATVNAKLQTAAVTAAGVPVGSGAYFHMSSEPVFYSTGTIPITSITQSLTRNVAKINVDASALVTPDFELEGVTLVNGAQKGFVFKQAAISVNHGGNMKYDEKNTVTGNKLLSEIYLYENTGLLSDGTTPNPTKLIVRGKYKGGQSGYYRMDILKNNSDGTYTPYDIKRNYCYTLKIKKIENGGYLTLDEAVAGEPSNTWYEVVVNDPNSYDIVSNGHYYMGVSNSEFIVYGDAGQIDDLLITTVTTDAPAGTKTAISSSPDIILLTTVLGTPTGSAVKTDIRAELNSSTNGYIDIRVGNLTKRITVKRKASVICENSEKIDFTDSEYVTGEVISGTEWVRLATASNANFNMCPPSLIKPTGGIYVRYNSTLNMNASRSAELYVSKANNQGRAKMLMFATKITYSSNTIPDNIDKNGKDVNSNSTFTATFTNPGNYPFKAEIKTGSTLLMETTSTIAATKSIDLAGAKVTNGSVILPRPMSLCYNVNGVSFTTTRNFQQRALLTVRILSVGGNALSMDNNGTPNYGTMLGSALPGQMHTDAIGKMFTKHTGVGKPISYKFELFNLSDGPTASTNGSTRYTNIGNILRNNNIDILFCSINNSPLSGGGPNAAQTQEILAWLDENPYRGMIFITDYIDNAEISKAVFGVSHTSSGGLEPFSKLPSNDPYYDHPVYKAIMCGSYSTSYTGVTGNPIDLRETTFANSGGGGNAYGGVPLAATNSRGFIPIFYVTIGGNQYVLFTVHPEKNIVMMGDINWFAYGQQFANSNGDLTATPYGNFPKMIMNMWEWYINSVALGKGQ